jgi:hypothetical protein
MAAMTARLRLPTALAFTVVGVAVAAAAIASCGDGKPTTADAACNLCVYETVDNGNCPYPTCATGSNSDECPDGCMVQPIA